MAHDPSSHWLRGPGALPTLLPPHPSPALSFDACSRHLRLEQPRSLPPRDSVTPSACSTAPHPTFPHPLVSGSTAPHQRGPPAETLSQPPLLSHRPRDRAIKPPATRAGLGRPCQAAACLVLTLSPPGPEQALDLQSLGEGTDARVPPRPVTVANESESQPCPPLPTHVCTSTHTHPCICARMHCAHKYAHMHT